VLLNKYHLVEYTGCRLDTMVVTGRFFIKMTNMAHYEFNKMFGIYAFPNFTINLVFICYDCSKVNFMNNLCKLQPMPFYLCVCVCARACVCVSVYFKSLVIFGLASGYNKNNMNINLLVCINASF
jgi:hypothetical protein